MLTLTYPKPKEQIATDIPNQENRPIENLEMIEDREEDWLCKDTYYRDDNYY